jgi:hypothetical protein
MEQDKIQVNGNSLPQPILNFKQHLDLCLFKIYMSES